MVTAPPASPMALLQQGIPLSLLLDLVCGPASEDLLAHEHVRGSALADALLEGSPERR